MSKLITVDYKLTDDEIKSVLKLVYEGKGITKSCEETGVSYYKFSKHLRNDENLQQELSAAREANAEVQVQKAINLADAEPERNFKTGGIDTGYVQLTSMRTGLHKWLASRYNPKVYGDSTTLKGDKDNPIFNFALELNKAKNRLEKVKEEEIINLNPTVTDADYTEMTLDVPTTDNNKPLW